MSSQMAHLQIDLTESIPCYGIKLFGMVISVPPLTSSNAPLPVPEPVDHHIEDTSSCLTKSGSLKDESLVKLQRASLEIGGFGSAFDEIAAERPNMEAPTAVKLSTKSFSSARGHCRRTVNEHSDSAQQMREADLKIDGSEKTNPRKLDDPNLPCPRCDSWQTKFCYFNNYNVNQPRHFCRQCQRYWTAGGTLRDVPMGAGRRKRKQHADIIDAAVDRAIARGNAADAAQQLLFYAFGKPCAIDMPIPAPRVSMHPEVSPEMELSLAAQSDVSNHVSLGQMYKADLDCDETFCHEKLLPLEFEIGSKMIARCGSPWSGPEVPFDSESLNDARGAAPGTAMLTAVVAATKSHFDLGNHTRDATYEGGSQMRELARSRHG